MISYCHEDDQFCDRILDFLSSPSIRLNIWIDRIYSNKTGNSWESIASGIKLSSTIVCLISDNYLASKSCRQEFIYAVDSLKKPIVPVLLGNLDPKGWLGKICH
jgi:hypothetical protein